MPSIRYRIIKRACKFTGSKRMYSQAGEDFRQAVLANPRNRAMAPAPQELLHGITYTQTTICETPCVIFEPTIAAGRDATRLPIAMFIPGGGFVLHAGNLQWRFCADIVRSAGIRVVMVDYPTAPDHCSKEALDILCAVYDVLQQRSIAPIGLFGDSAGGGLALSLTMLLRERGIRQPICTVAASPAVTLRQEGTPGEMQRYTALHDFDPVLSSESFPAMAQWWSGPLDVSDWRVSPIMGDLTGLAPMAIFTGTHDVLNVSARKFLREAVRQKAPILFVERPELMHDYVVLHCPEGNRDRARIAQLLVEGMEL